MHSARILIVDDEKNVRLALSQALEDVGLIVESASEGKTALRQLQHRPYDLLVLDVKMPGLSGIEALRRVRAHHPDLPVVMLTAHGSIETAVQATQLGAADFLQKPVSLDDLRTCIGRALSRSALDAEVASSYNDWMELAKRYVQQQQFADAHHCLHAALDADATRPGAHTLLGLLHVAAGEVEMARKHYRRALEATPDALTARLHLDQLETGVPPFVLDRALSDESARSHRLQPTAFSKPETVPRFRVLVGLKERRESGWTRIDRLLVRVAAASAAAHADGELLLLQVLEVPRQLAPSQAATAHRGTMQHIQEQLQRLGRSVTPSELALQTLVVAGHDVASVLRNTVETVNVRHAVLGWSEGRTRKGKTLRRMDRSTTCALTFVRPERPVSDGIPAPRRIVALVNDSPHAPYAVRRAMELAQQTGVATLTLLNVQSREVASSEALQRRGQRTVWNVADRAGLDEGQYATRVMLARNTDRALLEAASEYDTVCVGASRNTALTEALFGSVPDRLRAATGGTVVVARGPHLTDRSVFDALGNRLGGS